MNPIEKLSQDDRVTVRRPGTPDPCGNCVVYWMQRAQRARDNPALDVAICVANELKKPVVAFFAPVPFYPGANLRHYSFMVENIPDLAEELAACGVGFVLRTYPDHSLLKFCADEARLCLYSAEDPEFDAWRWVDYWDPLGFVVPFKRSVYARALLEFSDFVAGLTGQESTTSASDISRSP